MLCILLHTINQTQITVVCCVVVPMTMLYYVGVVFVAYDNVVRFATTTYRQTSPRISYASHDRSVFGTITCVVSECVGLLARLVRYIHSLRLPMCVATHHCTIQFIALGCLCTTGVTQHATHNPILYCYLTRFLSTRSIIDRYASHLINYFLLCNHYYYQSYRLLLLHYHSTKK